MGALVLLGTCALLCDVLVLVFSVCTAVLVVLGFGGLLRTAARCLVGLWLIRSLACWLAYGWGLSAGVSFFRCFWWCCFVRFWVVLLLSCACAWPQPAGVFTASCF